jgi:ferric-dicitrate binding protein FerR (iron transport regulator)
MDAEKIDRIEDLPDYEMLVDYLSGLATPRERDAIDARAEADPAFRSMLDDSRIIWERVPLALPSGTEAARPLKLPRQRGQRASRLGWVASALAAAAVVLIVLIPLRTSPTPRPAESTAVASPIREYRTGANQRTRLVLSDGSIVEMGANSRVRAPQRFGRALREIELDGLAFFEISHDPDRPFLVHAGDATTKVLGTKFAVEAYVPDHEVRVAVTEGRVALAPAISTGSAPALITPGQLGLLSRDGIASVIQDAREFDRLIGWKDGRREYADVPLSEVLSDLERWYGQTIIVSDPELAARPVSTVLKGEPLEQVLHLLALVVDAQYERRGSSIVFTPQPDPVSP